MQVVCKKKNHFHTHGVSFSNFEKTHVFLSFLEKDKTTRLFVFFRKRQKDASFCLFLKKRQKDASFCLFLKKKYDYTVFLKKTKKTEKRHRLF